MKKFKSIGGPQKLLGEIQLLRLRLARAESSVKAAKEQARVAKRRRKEAKRTARRARKQLKQAKAELAKAKLALAEVEENLARTGERAAKARKSTKARQTEKAPVGKSKATKKPAPARRIRKVRSAAADARVAGRRATPGKSKARPAASRSAIKSVIGGAAGSIAVPRDSDNPEGAIPSFSGSNADASVTPTAANGSAKEGGH